MKDDCVFTGALLDPIPIMAGADLYCCPALHHGISNSIIEACALGKPIVATKVGQTNEIVHNGKNGHLVPAKNISALKSSIIKLLSNREQCKSFGDYGKDLVAKSFNIEIQAAKYLELYNKLLNEHTK